jgi:hypothetical protein
VEELDTARANATTKDLAILIMVKFGTFLVIAPLNRVFAASAARNCGAILVSPPMTLIAPAPRTVKFGRTLTDTPLRSLADNRRAKDPADRGADANLDLAEGRTAKTPEGREVDAELDLADKLTVAA